MVTGPIDNGVARAVLLPEQSQRDVAVSAELFEDRSEVGCGILRRCGQPGGDVQPPGFGKRSGASRTAVRAAQKLFGFTGIGVRLALNSAFRSFTNSEQYRAARDTEFQGRLHSRLTRLSHLSTAKDRLKIRNQLPYEGLTRR